MNRLETTKDVLFTDMHRCDGETVVWERESTPISYEKAVSDMEDHVFQIRHKNQLERIWLVEHPPVYTAGTRANTNDLLNETRFPVFKTGRGGEYTYHGPGQRIAYVMLDLTSRKQDVRHFVAALEQWVINTLGQFNIKGERREDRVGVWVVRPEKPPLPDGTPREDKIAAIGIRLRKWVTFHGISLNVDPNLEHYSGIVPCGVEGHGVTSLVDLGLPVSMEDVDLMLKQEFEKLFGMTR
ncbi:MAG: lipoyl(octanoyl) transferase LipB [Pseudomonadota bacterium]